MVVILNYLFWRWWVHYLFLSSSIKSSRDPPAVYFSSSISQSPAFSWWWSEHILIETSSCNLQFFSELIIYYSIERFSRHRKLCLLYLSSSPTFFYLHCLLSSKPRFFVSKDGIGSRAYSFFKEKQATLVFRNIHFYPLIIQKNIIKITCENVMTTGANFIELLSRKQLLSRICWLPARTFIQNVCKLAGSLFYIA